MFAFCDVCGLSLEPDSFAYHCLDCEDVDLCPDCFAAHGADHPHLMVLERVMMPARWWRQLAWCRSIGNIYFHALLRFARRPLFGMRLGAASLRAQDAPPLDLHRASRRISQPEGPVDWFRVLPPATETSAETSGGAGGIQWLTYQGALTVARALGSALRHRLSGAARIGLCAANSPQWMCLDMGCAMYGFPVVPFHRTLSDADMVGLIRASAQEALVVDLAEMPRFQSILPDCPLVRYLIVIDPASDIRHPGAFFDGESTTLEHPIDASVSTDDAAHWEECTLSSLLRMGLDSPLPLQPMPAEDLLTITYTSGSTGRPKGVVFSGRSWRQRFCRPISISPEVAVSFQPLGFASARSNAYISLVNGGCIGFHESPTGEDEFGGIFETFQLFRPSVIVSVPRLWNRLYGDFQAALALARLQQKLEADTYPTAHDDGVGTHEAGVLAETATTAGEAGLVSQVMAGFRELLGGRTQLLLSGGAPIAAPVLAFLEECYAARAADGYGSTECGGITSEERLKDEVEYRLEDVPSLGYLRDDQPYPRGELWVKTEGMADGYLHEEEAAEERFVDGWFRTGDIVAEVAARTLRVIDRVDHVTKLAQGVFVAPEPLEQCYQASPFVSQIYLHCDPLRSDILALIVPNCRALAAALLVEQQAPGSSPKDAATAPGDALPSVEMTSVEAISWLQQREEEALALLRRSLAGLAEGAELQSYERPRGIGLIWVPFAIDNQQLTASSKLSRQTIARDYAAVLDALALSVDALDTRALRSQVLGILATQIPGLASHIETKDPLATQALGIDSLAAVSIRSEVLARCKIDLPLEELLHTRDLDALLDLMVTPQQRPVVGAEILYQDAIALGRTLAARAADDSCARQSTQASGTSRLLLTGATGFVGPHLLVSLLAQYPMTTIVCLVRGRDEEEAWQRLQQACERQGVWQTVASSRQRLRLCLGDLAARRLGLSPAAWDELVKELALVVHNGAQVNHLMPYQHLRAANVEGTASLLHLAAEAGARVLLVSSTSAVTAAMWSSYRCGDSAERLYSPTMTHFAGMVGRDGYGQSKAVAEALLGEAHKSGVPCQIVRPGYIGPHSITGAGNPEGAIERLLLACWLGGMIPRVEEGAGMQLLAIDVCTRAIGAYSTEALSAPGVCQVNHLYHPKITPWASLFAALEKVAKAQGRALVSVPYARWWQEMGRAIEGHPLASRDRPKMARPTGHPLVGLHGLWRDDLPDQQGQPWPAPARFAARSDVRGVGLPPDVLERWVRWILQDAGWLGQVGGTN